MGQTNDNPTYPTWITGEYFHEVLKTDEPNYIKVAHCSVEKAIPQGENYASAMFRVHLDLKMKHSENLKKKSYILKTMLDDDQGGSAVREMCIFPKEMKMYQTYLPAFEALYAKADWQVQLAPKCLLIENDGDRANLVFEDLRPKNFKNINRLYGMDMPHMVRTMQKLAEYHAASAVYEEQNGPYPSEYHKGFVSGDGSDEYHKTMFDAKVNGFKKAIALWGLEDADKYIEKFPTYEQYEKCAQRCLDTKDNIFNVLTHGDFWSSNVMQSYLENGDINEILIIDYQFCKWGSPAEDLLFFITLSAANDIRIPEYEHFIEIYHEHLVKCLRALKYQKKVPKLRELQMEMYREQPGFYAFFAVFNHIPLILFPKGANMGILLTNTKEADDLRAELLTNPAFVDAMKTIYPFYHRRGLFNFEDYD